MSTVKGELEGSKHTGKSREGYLKKSVELLLSRRWGGELAVGLGCGTVHPVAAGSLKHAFPHLLELVERIRRVRQHLELGHGDTVAC